MRAGGTLVELLVAVVLTSLILGTATRSVLTQHRDASRLGIVTRDDAQRRSARGAVAADLALLGTRDLMAAESSDSTLQIRALVASGLACATGAGWAALTSPNDAVIASGGVISPPRTGDSLWWRPGAAGQGWRGTPIVDAAPSRVPCGGVAVQPSSFTVTTNPRDTIYAGAPLRVTRQLRYVLYRSSGAWQLGLREWNETTRAMGAPQPIAGPFERPSTGLRSGFQYLDREGREAAPAGASRVRLTLVWVSEGWRGARVARSDTLDAALAGGAP